MRAQQVVWNHRSGWTPAAAGADKVPLVLYFGTREALPNGVRFNELRIMFPAAHILGCSTGGQINNNDVNDDDIVAAAISFDATRLRLCREEITIRRTREVPAKQSGARSRRTISPACSCYPTV
jgi:hypothetical protein